MRLRFTEAALRDLDEIMQYIGTHFPGSEAGFEHRLRQCLARIERWPAGAQAVASRADVRVIPLVRYPYRLFYRTYPDEVAILHIHHTARRDPD